MSQIAFTNLQGQLEVVDTSTMQRRALTTDGRRYMFPTWSPDGQSIAAVGNGHQFSSLTVSDISSDEATRDLYTSKDQRPFYVYWSPDSTFITFLANHPRNGIGLHLVPANGGVSRLISSGQPFFWSWQGDSERMLVHVGGGELTARVMFVNPFDQSEGQNLADPGYFQTPGISPSGRFYAFADLDQNQHGNVIVENRRSRKRQKFKHDGAITLSWSPTQDKLAYISPFRKAQHFYGLLRIVNPHESTVEVLVEDIVLAFFWSPDGNKIAYLTLAARSWSEQSEKLVRSGYAKGRRLPVNASLNLWLNLRVVDVRTGKSQLLTPFQPNRLFINQFLPFFDQYALSHRIWSPDSDAIVLPVVIEDQEHIVIIPIDGFPPIPVAQGQMAAWSHG